ncbi:YshB family small membrane protein [Acerihabitans sp. TG2]|nr:YshB family small membrane protein [Acerihabitans sp. TG2]MEA9392399.1 YshB family small membrane protein [Acerihabitans sp. TG2]
MLNSLMSFITHGADLTAAVGHAPQTALAAILCAALINLFG